MTTWRGIPEDKRSDWRTVFLERGLGPLLKAPCPICGERSLRRYFNRARTFPAMPPGVVGRGGSWEWCASCGSYEHSSGLVPVWWVPVAVVQEAELAAEPEQLERQFREAGLIR
jgi:hypothetical protein